MRLRIRGVQIGGGLLVAALVLASCNPRRRDERPAASAGGAPLALPVEIIADSGRGQRWPMPIAEPPRVWMASVSPARAAPPEPPLPDAAPDTLLHEPPPPPPLAIDEDLKPPVLRTPALLRLPPELERRARGGSVELDVRVDEQGFVSDALWAGGSEDSALVAAATDCALRMRFFAALRNGAPVAVWCRQRFDFAGR
jgi:TonB family protein